MTAYFFADDEAHFLAVGPCFVIECLDFCRHGRNRANDSNHGRSRSVMAVLHARCFRYSFTGDESRVEAYVGHDGAEHINSHAAGTKNGQFVVGIAFNNS